MPSLHQTPLARQKNLIVTELNDETIVYDSVTNALHTLNASAAEIWRMCDGQTTVTEMAQRLIQRYPKDQAEAIVWFTLNQLHQKKLLDTELTTVPSTVGMTRRELIGRVAVSALFALPLIQSMTAPSAAQAISGTTTGTTRPPTTTGTTPPPTTSGAPKATRP